jgi:adenosylmethionine-8-amino-7-oxononanoate aminotransferase
MNDRPARPDLPAPSPALSAAERHVWHPFTQMSEWEAEEPLMIAEGDAEFLIDTAGNRYLDGVSSLWCNLHGHRRPEIDSAVAAQLRRIAHSTLLGLGSVPAAQLAERLCRIAPAGLSRVFFSDDGATALEVALKMSFQFWAQNGRPQRTGFVAFRGAYHGDTLGAAGVGGIELFHKMFRPLLHPAHFAPAPYCYRCELKKDPATCGVACVEEVDRLLRENADRIAAVVVEPLVQGAGGMITAPPGHLRRLREITAAHGVHLIADEVAVGFGRTGTMFACEAEGVAPDFLCLAKGLTGGYLPLAATLTTDEVYAGFLGRFEDRRTFFHGHTYTGNALGCAAALASLDIFESGPVLERVRELSARLAARLARLADHPHVGQIRQRGLIVGIELVADRTDKRPFDWTRRTGMRVCREARRHGVIIRPLGDVVVLMPPLSIRPENLDRLADVTADGIERVTRG